MGAGEKKLLLVASPGGHMSEMIKLANVFSNDLVEIALASYGISDEERFVWAKQYYPVRWYGRSLRAMFTFWDSINVIRKYRPDWICSTGGGVCVPFFICAAFYRIPCVYIESFSRPGSFSLTGTILDHLKLTRYFYVRYENQRNLGRLRKIYVAS